MQKRNHFKRLQQKKYSTGSYRNPYFNNKKKHVSQKLLVIAAITLALSIGLILLFSLPAFKLTRVVVSGLQPSAQSVFERQANDYLNTSHLLFFRNTNRFLFSNKRFQSELSKQFAFESVQIHIAKESVFVDLKEHVSQFVWKTGADSYLADLGGILIQKVEAPLKATMLSLPQNVKPLPTFVDRNNTPVTVGDQILSADEIKNIFLFVQQLAGQSIFTKEIQIDRLAGKWRGVLTTTGYTILFDPSTDVTQQSIKLKTLLQNTLKDTSHLQYIDLRFGDHVYYK